MANDDGLSTTDTMHIPKLREEVEYILVEKGLEKQKGSNQYVGPNNVSIFLTREGSGTEVVYMGPESELQKYKDLLEG